MSVFLSGVVGLLLIEVGARLTDYPYQFRRTAFPDYYFRADAVLGADHSTNFERAAFEMRGPGFEVFTNDFGCFDADAEIASDYILAVGDSATWGYVSSSKNWTHKLQTISGRQILNCGVSGVGTRYAMLKAAKVIDQIGFPPSMILLRYINNDLNDDFVFPSYTVIDGQRLDRVKSIDLQSGKLDRHSEADLAHRLNQFRQQEQSVSNRLLGLSVIFQTARQVLASPPAPTPSGPTNSISNRYGTEFWMLDLDKHAWTQALLQRHWQNFEEFHALAAKWNTQLVVLDDRGPFTNTSQPARVGFFERLESMGTIIAFTFDDLDPSEVGRLRHTYDPHYNEYGNSRIADEVYGHLLELDLL